MDRFSIVRARPGHMLVKLDNGCEVSMIWTDDAYCDCPRERRKNRKLPDYSKVRYLRKNAKSHLIRTILHKKNVEVLVRGKNGSNITHLFRDIPGNDGYIISSVSVWTIIQIIKRLGGIT